MSKPQHIVLLACQKKKKAEERIQIENKEFSKSRVVAMLFQTRKGKGIIKGKKKSCETYYALEVLIEKQRS